MPLVSRTRATLRRAEFGFFGVVVYTRVHTPRRCGAATFFLRPFPDFRPGVASFFLGAWRPLRINWLVVGMRRCRLAGARRGPRHPGAGGAATRAIHRGADHQAGTPARATSTLTCCTPTASATGAYVTSPLATLTPSLRPGFSTTAWCTPALARCSTYGI